MTAIGSSVAAASTAGAVGAAVLTDWSPSDLPVLSGVFCGALVYLLRSRESSILRKAVYFCVSLLGGHAMVPVLQGHVTWLPDWPAAFLSAATVVTFVTLVLDWSETALPRVVKQFLQRLFGGFHD